MTIQKNSCHIITIDDISDKAQGICRVDGFPVVVDGALAGEELEIKIIKVTKNFAVGKLLQVLKPAEERIQPFCPVFTRCGGCSLQHMSYGAQLNFKTARVREHFDTAGLSDTLIHPTLGMESPLHYRNKAQYPVGQKKGIPQLGFYASYSHEIIEHDECRIHPLLVDKIMAFLRTYFLENAVSIYDERSRQGLLRHVLIRIAQQSGEAMLVLVINGSEFPAWEKLVIQLTTEVPEVTNLVLNENSEAHNAILGKRKRTLYGEGIIRDRLGGYEFEISASSFYQVNSRQTEVLYGKVLDYASLTGEDIVFDLYCGVGTIAVFLARHARKVYGVEVNREAVLNARRNAALNNLSNVTVVQGEADKAIMELARLEERADLVVLDPPRKGCSEELLERISAMNAKRIVYISCNPTTVARDLAFLAQKGFKTAEVQPVDMFPHTLHIECVARIERC
ncbi:MAG: 23S rRNA (uracil(1939)-C(5))-methyltransferase RlmD [bacterium]|nr:23S rRNA (uracil(1939)-C(5))-methyltransferase RlmD [bacterium]